MSNYTSGPLMYDGECRIDAVQFRAPSGFICEDGSEHMDGLIALPYACADGTSEGNARRLVACWNACRGLATESLEPAGVVVRKDLDAMRAQRDELLEALIEVSASLAWNVHGECRAIHDGPLMPSQQAIEFARAAIAKALGEVEQAEQIAEAA